MTTNELYLKTLFCCSACDGEIAPEEVELVKNISLIDPEFFDLDVEALLNCYVEEINSRGALFLQQYLAEVDSANLTDAEQLKLAQLAIKMIEADHQILYSEVKFFKKIRSRLTISDQALLEAMPDCEDFLLPDTATGDYDFEMVGNFAQISLSIPQA